jgi:RNA polymerase sigma factor (sigma-70 family)
MKMDVPKTHFVTTRWTLLEKAADGGNEEALETLIQIYWQPLYRYARRMGKSIEDAEDLVQGFLAHLIEKQGLSQIDQNKGRFRAFLLASFNHWMRNDWKFQSREKRGGGVSPLSFDWEDAETGLKIEVADKRSPDREFDREWALTLLNKVLEDLQTALKTEGGASQFQTLKPCLTIDSQQIHYAELAAELSMSEGAVRVAVHRLRKRYRHLLTSEISRTLSREGNLEEEMQALFVALAE